MKQILQSTNLRIGVSSRFYIISIYIFLLGSALIVNNKVIAQCDVTIVMNDSWGDGWNGGNLEIFFDGVSQGVYAAAGNGSTTNLTIPAGQQMTVEYNSGNWENENTYTISIGGSQVFSDGTNPAIGLVYSYDCPGGSGSNCGVVIQMNDSWGDGWNGGNLEIFFDGVSQGTFAATGNGSTVNLTIPAGQQMTVEYNSGNWENENTYTISISGSQVFSDGTNPATGLVYAYDCPGGCSTPAPPSASNQTVNCGDPATLNASGAPSNGDYVWYDDSNGVNQVGSGNSFTTPFLSASITYYVSVLVPGNCESSLVPADININPIASPVVNGSTSICENQSTTLTASGAPLGGDYAWYSDAAGNNLLGTGATFNTPSLNNNTTYYVEATSGSGPSGTYNQTLTNTALNNNNTFTFPGTPTGATGSATLIVSAYGDIDGTGGNLEEWSIDNESNQNIGSVGGSGNFNDQCSSTLTTTITLTATEIDALASSGDIVFTAADLSGNINTTLCGGDFVEMQLTYDYSSGTNCTSNLIPVSIIVNPNPVAPILSGGGTICFGEQLELNGAGGNVPPANWVWHENTVNGPQLGNGLSTIVSPSSTTDYLVEVPGNGGCAPAVSNTITVALQTPDNTISGNNAQATCRVAQNGYVHFLDPNGKLIASINSNGQNLGQVSATSFVEGTPLQVLDCSGSIFTSVLDRHWVITPEFQPSGPVEVVLPLSSSEEQSLIQEANSNNNPNDDLGGLGNIALTKYAGPNNIDNMFPNNCLGQGGNETLDLFNQTNSGNVSDYWPTYSGQDLYTSFTTNSFSEFWLHGSSNNSPLPVEMNYFNVDCETEAALINWETASEQNSSHFDLQKSRDGQTWETIYTTNAAGNTNSTSNYSYLDINAGNDINYYRLAQIDFDGYTEIFGPISSQCESQENSINVYPNPSDNDFIVVLNSSSDYSETNIILLDLNGRIIINREVQISAGQNAIHFKSTQLAPGSYLVKLSGTPESFKHKKLIIN